MASQRANPPRAGVGLKAEHYRRILETRPDIGFFEVHAENYMGAGRAAAPLSRRDPRAFSALIAWRRSLYRGGSSAQPSSPASAEATHRTLSRGPFNTGWRSGVHRGIGRRPLPRRSSKSCHDSRVPRNVAADDQDRADFGDCAAEAG
ncbi:MAG: DUF692 family protein [Acetobacteraceae bacterium]|nr:DUF692 family protein [Acetobacteraceae bacterium]